MLYNMALMELLWAEAPKQNNNESFTYYFILVNVVVNEGGSVEQMLLSISFN